MKIENQTASKKPIPKAKNKSQIDLAKTKKLAEIDADTFVACLATSPSVNAASAILPWSKAPYGESKSVDALIDKLREGNSLIADGNMKTVEEMLFDQALVLQMMFTNLTRRAANQEHLLQFQTHLNLGMKAQAQCRATLEALAEIKNPRQVAFVKQANMASGNQQVNNGQHSARSDTRTHAGEFAKQSNELSEVRDGLLPNPSTSSTSSGIGAKLKALGKVDRAEN